MPKWSELLSRIIPWLDTDDATEQREIREEMADLEKEQHALAPFIADQTAYLERKGRINGFSDQLRRGFQQRAAEE